ncbi:hypothetical protein PRIPAC_76595 [Pristionchus pacificus]|uniref:Uncharacterized protein n=1 Tax=Pristionchus pacificus TaxID=54126 RepID=A0A2A6BFY0_PRIPA|nr:hypothetical protein PRIPAC_76595 [Pristionchus pacificus]|eukprot:PDM64825.1 hypothetical protein PRIPAC_53081 [Pristionchus pacificus]
MENNNNGNSQHGLESILQLVANEEYGSSDVRGKLGSMGSESSLVAKLETLPHAFDAVRAGSRHLVFEGDTVVHSEMGVLADVGDAVVGSPTVGLNFRTGGNMLDDEREQVVDERLPADRRPIGTTQLMLHGAERGLLPGEGIQHAEEGADIDPSAGEPGVPQGREGGGTVVATPTISRPRRTLLQLVLHAGHRTLRAHESAPQQAAGAEMGDDGVAYSTKLAAPV